MTRPHILYLTPWFSATPTSASEVRAFHVAKALEDIGKVEVVTVSDSIRGHPSAAEEDDVPVACAITTETCANDTWAKKARWLLDARVPQPHGVAADEASSDIVRQMAVNCELTWIYKLRTANMFPNWVWRRSVVDIDDVPSLFESSVLASDLSVCARAATQLRVWCWRRRERLLGERFNLLTVCSEADKRHLARLRTAAPVHVIPNGFEAPKSTRVRRLASPPRFGFIGVFDHAPNVEGVHWFVRHSWPIVKRELPDARLRLIGRFTDGPLTAAGPDIDALGYVPEPDDEMSTWAGMVVPIRTGAGTRGKIAHAFSQKCPVVSTPLGAYGYEPLDGRDMLLAESPELFARACVRLVREPNMAVSIAEQAWRRFVMTWSWDAIRPSIWSAAQQCLRQERTGELR